MKTKVISLLLCLGMIVACNNTQKGAAIGAGGGAVLGGIIGAIAGNTAIGAAVGGASVRRWTRLRLRLRRFRMLRLRP